MLNLPSEPACTRYNLHAYAPHLVMSIGGGTPEHCSRSHWLRPSRPPVRVQAALRIAASYNAARGTIDSHLDDALSQAPNPCATDAAFIRQAVYGTVRYAPLLASFKAAFYHHCGGTALRADAPLYALLTYLAVLRIEDLGTEQFERVLRAHDAQKMHVWANFLFDEAHLRHELREEWQKVYDKAYIDSRIGEHLPYPAWLRSIA